MVEKRRGIVTMGGQPVTLVGREVKVGIRHQILQLLKGI